MAYRRGGGYSRRSSSGYSRGRSTGYRASSYRPRKRAAAPRRASGRRTGAARGQQVVRILLEQAPASGISRANERVLSKMNPPPGKAKM